MPVSQKVKGGQERGWHVALALLTDTFLPGSLVGWGGGLSGYLQELCSPPHHFEGG